MRPLTKRLISSVVLISVVITALFWLPLWAFAFVVAAFITAALYEFYTMVRQRGILVHRPLAIGLGLIYVGLAIWRALVEPGAIPTPILGPQVTGANLLWDLFWPATIIVVFIRQLTRENTFEALSGLATTLFGIAYIAALFSYLFYIRALDLERGAWLVFFLVFVTKMGDAGAYLVGRIAGRHTLLPRISPRKTVEGFIGAIVFSAAAAMVAYPLLERPGLTLVLSGLLGVFLGFCGQLGDLAESLIKRDCQVKDSGTALPGLGGALDVIDSLLFTAPLFYGILIYA